MTIRHIQQGTEKVMQFYAAHPEKARRTEEAAVAVLETGLRCRATGARGQVLISDMPQAIGGGASAPTPGWFLRAALANCDATVIAMRAAQLGIVLTRLDVTVDSESDERGLFGIGDVWPGPLSMHVRVRIAAKGATSQQLHDPVAWAEAHSPVGDALRRAVPLRTVVDVG